MHHDPLARTPDVVLADCWTGLAPLVPFASHPTPPPAQATRSRLASRLRRLLNPIA